MIDTVVESADVLLEHIAATGGDDSTTQSLLDEFFSGYPVERLRRLLRSDNEDAVKNGVWIASELGDLSAPLLTDLTALLGHSSKYVRFFAIDSILSAATAQHGEIIAGAIQLIDDAEEAVRWKAMNFLAQASDYQLEASLRHILDPEVASLTSWLLECNRMADVEAASARVSDSRPVARLVAGAAAARLSDRNLAALEAAAESDDPEVSSFALENLRALRERRRS